MHVDHSTGPYASAAGDHCAATMLEQRLLEGRMAIEAWLGKQWRQTPPPFYCSLDLRNAGYKLTPVDTNLFPAGFNNLSPAARAACIPAVQAALARVDPTAQRVLLVPERHTRNRFYLANVDALCALLRTAGFEVRTGLPPPLAGKAPTGTSQLRRWSDRIGVDGFIPDIVLLNNDLSAGLPAILVDISQPIVPPPGMGWMRRRKSGHFSHYRTLAAEFCQLLHMDPWLIDPLFCRCDGLDFRHRKGEERLAETVDELLRDITDKYAEHGIDRTPFVAIKADAGTYGMSVMMVRSAAQVRQLNRRQRNKMAVAKDGMPVTQVIVQEGVPTMETAGPERAVAEPVVYLIDGAVVGGFYRLHRRKGNEDNLNAPGMAFTAVSLADSPAEPAALPEARRYAYSVIGRLAALAAGREIQDLSAD